MRIRLAIPDAHLDGPMLDAALEAVTRAARREIETGQAPLARDGIRRGVRWRPEAFTDGEHFDLPSTVMRRGWGDCDDLAPWHAASLRATGRDPKARAVARKSGPQRWHVVVRRGDGSIEDPSRAAGMAPSVSGVDCMGVCGARSAQMAMPGDGAIALVPSRGLWWGRTDLPWGKSDSHLASLAASPNAHKALARALRGALLASDVASPVHREYARALMRDLLAPRTHRAHAVGFLGDVLDIAKGPLGGMAASLIPGGGMVHSALSSIIPGGKKAPPKKGAPAAPAAAAAAAPGGGGGGGGHPMASAPLPGGGHIAWAPQGPLIVRF